MGMILSAINVNRTQAQISMSIRTQALKRLMPNQRARSQFVCLNEDQITILYLDLQTLYNVIYLCMLRFTNMGIAVFITHCPIYVLYYTIVWPPVGLKLVSS